MGPARVMQGDALAQRTLGFLYLEGKGYWKPNCPSDWITSASPINGSRYPNAAACKGSIRH